jgi:hypothetical protein
LTPRLLGGTLGVDPMVHRRFASILSVALTATFACTTVYLPEDDPLTEATLSEAIETLRDSDGRVELLEDGIIVDLFVFEWRRIETSHWRDPRDYRIGGGLGADAEYQRRLVGPKRDVYLPYTSILAVRARSWPLWSGVELELDAAFQLRDSRVHQAPLGRTGDDDPVVIKARDEQDAQSLSEAIDRIRRARLPVAEPAEPAEPADSADSLEPAAVPEAASAEAEEPDAAAD